MAKLQHLSFSSILTVENRFKHNKKTWEIIKGWIFFRKFRRIQIDLNHRLEKNPLELTSQHDENKMNHHLLQVTFHSFEFYWFLSFSIYHSKSNLRNVISFWINKLFVYDRKSSALFLICWWFWFTSVIQYCKAYNSLHDSFQWVTSEYIWIVLIFIKGSTSHSHEVFSKNNWYNL